MRKSVYNISCTHFFSEEEKLFKQEATEGCGRHMQQKRRSHSRQKRKVSVKRAILLLVVCVLLLLCVSQGFVQLIDVIHLWDEKQSLETLDQVRNAGELMVNDLLTLSEPLVGDEDLLTFSLGHTGTEKRVISRFSKLVKNSSLLADIYLVTPNRDVCLTSRGKEDLSGITLMLSPWSEKLLWEPQTFTGPFRLLSLAPGKNPKVSSLVFMRPVMDQDANRVGMLLFTLERDSVNVRNGTFMLPSQYCLYWMDSNNNVLYSSNTALNVPIPQFQDLRENMPVYMNDKAENVFWVSSKSAHSNFAYILVATYENHISTALRVYFPVIIGITIVLLALLYLFIRYAQRQSRTINNSLRVLAEKGIVSRNDMEDERLDSLVIKLVAEREILNERLSRYRSLDFDNKLARVFSGDALPDSSFNLPYTQFAVCVISVDNRSVFSQDKSINAQEEKALIKLVVDNVLNEKYVCYSRYMGQKILCLLNFEEKDESPALQTVYAELQTLRRVCEEELELIFIAGLSEVTEEVSKIHSLFEESIRAQEYAQMQSLTLVTYPEIEKKLRGAESMGNYYKRLIEKEKIVVENCSPWNYRNVCGAVTEFEKILFSNPANTFDSVKNKCREVVRAMVNTLRQSHSAEVYSPEHEANDLQELELCNTGEQIQVFFDLFLKKLDECITSSRAEEQDYFVAKVERILDKKYADTALSVGMIADELDMPMRLVSSQYKQKTGYGLLDRIHSFRVEKAKTMLLETQDSVYEIAERCGYENVNTFIRVFRKYTGQTPGRFRSS